MNIHYIYSMFVEGKSTFVFGGFVPMPKPKTKVIFSVFV